MEVYPLVNIQKAIDNGHRNSGFTGSPINSMVIFHIFFFVNVYQRVKQNPKECLKSQTGAQQTMAPRSIRRKLVEFLGKNSQHFLAPCPSLKYAGMQVWHPRALKDEHFLVGYTWSVGIVHKSQLSWDGMVFPSAQHSITGPVSVCFGSQLRFRIACGQRKPPGSRCTQRWPQDIRITENVGPFCVEKPWKLPWSTGLTLHITALRAPKKHPATTNPLVGFKRVRPWDHR